MALQWQLSFHCYLFVSLTEANPLQNVLHVITTLVPGLLDSKPLHFPGVLSKLSPPHRAPCLFQVGSVLNGVTWGAAHA